MKEQFLYSYSNTLENLQGCYLPWSLILLYNNQHFRSQLLFYREWQKTEVRIRIVYVFKNLGKRFFFLNQQTGVVTEKKSEMNVTKYGAEVGT